MLVANVALAIYALSLLDRAGAEVRYVDYGPSPLETPASRGCLATSAGERIINLYAYDSEGRLLDPVLLYDHNGQPIDYLCPAFDERGRRLSTEYPRDANGAPVINAFHRRQSVVAEPERPSLPGSSAQPDVTLPVNPPAVVGPPCRPHDGDPQDDHHAPGRLTAADRAHCRDAPSGFRVSPGARRGSRWRLCRMPARCRW